MTALIRQLQLGLRIFGTMRISDFLDIVIIAALIYGGLCFVSRTKIEKAARGVILILVILWFSDILGLNMLSALLKKAVDIGLIALIVIFQPEIRRLLERMGGSNKILTRLFASNAPVNANNAAIDQIILACKDMSASKTGALIIFERQNTLEEIAHTGTVINAEATAELIKNIFFVKAPLHDGAVIVRNGELLAAGCMLPMSSNMNLSKDLGMRHRAGIGMSERSDAVSLIVSEETGAISIAIDGMLKRHLTPENAQAILDNELMLKEPDGMKKSFLFRLRGKKDEQGQE